MANIKKIIAIADIHFRKYERREEYDTVLKQLYTELEQQKPDRIVVAGDIVHSYTTLTPELVFDVGNFLRKLSSLTEKVIIIPGNHDFVMKSKSRMDSITPILSNLKIDNISYYKNTGIYDDENVKWVIYSLLDDNIRPKGLDYKDSDKTYIGVFHGIVEGMSNAYGIELKGGLSKARFDGCDIVICGDVHKRQVAYMDEYEDANPIIMVGSLIQQDHGETIDGHGYCTVELGENINFSFKDLENPVKYYTFVVRGIESIENNSEVLIN